MIEILSGIAGWQYLIAIVLSALVVNLIGLPVNLPEKYRDLVLANGIVHLTSGANAEGIVSRNMFVRGKDGRVYFFVNRKIGKNVLGYNCRSRKGLGMETKVIVACLTREQVDKLRIRLFYDNSLSVAADFPIMTGTLCVWSLIFLRLTDIIAVNLRL